MLLKILPFLLTHKTLRLYSKLLLLFLHDFLRFVVAAVEAVGNHQLKSAGLTLMTIANGTSLLQGGG